MKRITKTLAHRRLRARRALLSRRDVLRAATGACLALPFLPSLHSARAAASSGPIKRFLPIYFPNGASEHWWTGLETSGSGDGWTLSNVLAPLQALKSKTIHIRNLGNYRAMQDNRQVEPSHARCSAAYLTCVDADARDQRNGISIDQLLVERAAFATPIDSLQLGLGTFPGFFDGRPWHYNQAVSWKASTGTHETEPLRRVVSPREVFEALVPWATPREPDPEDPAPNYDESILDEFLAESAALKAKLSRSDAQVVDQFETRIRELEILTGTVDTGMDPIPRCEVPQEEMPDIPDSDQELQGVASHNGADVNGTEYDRGRHAELMNQLIVLAFQCDLTRVVSYMLDDARSPFRYDHVTVEDFGGTPGDLNFHDGAQHNGDRLNNAYGSITQWMVQQTASLAGMLEAIPEGDGTMLDNTLMLLGSGMHSDDHDAAELPMVLIGGGPTFAHDQNVVLAPYPEDRQLRDLYFTILQRHFELDVEGFGEDRDGAPNALLEEILA